MVVYDLRYYIINIILLFVYVLNLGKELFNRHADGE